MEAFLDLIEVDIPVLIFVSNRILIKHKSKYNTTQALLPTQKLIHKARDDNLRVNHIWEGFKLLINYCIVTLPFFSIIQ